MGSIKLATLVLTLFSSLFVFSTPSYADEASAKPRNPLSEVKLKACRGVETGITERINKLNSYSANMLEKFDSIAMRVENYYTEKVLPSGKTVSNYSSLVADIALKKATVQTTLGEAEHNGAEFSCSGDSPKNRLKKYRIDMQAVKGALKNYRTSIRNLIVAVHSVSGEENKLTPEPTKS